MTENRHRCIKLLFAGQTKRINQNVTDLNSLKLKICSVCSINPNESNIKISHVNESNVMSEIINTQTLMGLLAKENSSCLKIHVEVPGKTFSKNEKKFNSEKEERLEKRCKDFVSSILDQKISVNLENPTESVLHLTEKQIYKIKETNHKFDKILLAKHKQPEYEISSNRNTISLSNDVIKPDLDSINNTENNFKFSDSQFEFLNIRNCEVIPPVNSIFNDICSICSRNIYYIKYICCVCSNAIICEKCEGLHFHPMIKCKDKEMSTKDDVLGLMKQNQEGHREKTSIFDNLFNRKIKLKLGVYSDFFTVRPNKNFRLPVVICNEGKNSIPASSKIIIVARNSKDLYISPAILDPPISFSERIDLLIECKSSDQQKVYDFELILYSATSSIQCDPLPVKIEVNNDEEDERINEFFAMYPKMHTLKKEEKGMIMYIIKAKISFRNPYAIYNILCRYDWYLEDALEELTSE